MSLIPDHIISEIRERADITEIVAKHVRIKKTGRYYKGLCPFHPEKTPSFTVSPAKQIYHCFGCGAGGNVFRFLMEAEGLTFVESVRELAQKFGVTIPEFGPRRGEIPLPSEREFLLKINHMALEYFQSLLRDPRRGQQARNYLESRSFGKEIQDKFKLGWSLPSWRDLLSHFEKKGIGAGKLERAGLVKCKEGAGDQTDSYYDRFRGRIIFPLGDTQGNIVGFAGRLIVEKDLEPKYLNSPETALFKKSQQLYGFHGAREHIRKNNQVLIVEGYFDQIRACQSGIENVVATCGTAFTAKQVTLLKNHTNNVVLVFDSDSAGQSATQKGFELLLEQEMAVQVLNLSQGEDPDSFIQKNGSDSFLKRLQTARSFLHHYILESKGSKPVQSVARKIEVINTVLPFLAKTSNMVERREGFQLLVDELGIEDRDLLAELKKSFEKNKPFLQKPQSKLIGRKYPEEYFLMHLMLSVNQVALKIRKEVELDTYREEVFQDLAQVFYAQIDRGEPVRADRALDELQSSEARSILAELSVSPVEFEDPWQAVADCIRKIRIRNLEDQIKALKKERNVAEQAGEMERSRYLQQRVREIQSFLNQESCVVG